MNDMTPAAGHNRPPDPLNEALAPYGDFITEAEGWLDGEPVKDEAAMNAVDALAKEIKAAKKDVTAAQKSESAPLHDAWKEALNRYKPTLDDLDRISKGLAALVGGFKRKLAEEKRAAERKAWEEAEAKRRAAEEADRKADTANIEEQRAAEEARREAMEAEKAAQAARKDAGAVKGLRKVTRYEITDHKDALHDIARHDRDAITAFIEEYVRKNHKARPITGVRVWEEREAF
ncbi:hypothetical protein [Ponticoccus litoralis]|uniref:Uncharacterized protein n=1 Tax=Ponticoccus litoralis TaxID=422297 RepID=A0AAW9SG49_9RHOB